MAGDPAAHMSDIGYNIPGGAGHDAILGTALEIATDGCNEINAVLRDIQPDNLLGNAEGHLVLDKYTGEQSGGTVNITEASGAMVIDDLMQKISTKVQVAAQLLSTANNINKTVSRIISQG